MKRRPPRSTLTDTLFPYPTPFLSIHRRQHATASSLLPRRATRCHAARYARADSAACYGAPFCVQRCLFRPGPPPRSRHTRTAPVFRQPLFRKPCRHTKTTPRNKPTKPDKCFVWPACCLKGLGPKTTSSCFAHPRHNPHSKPKNRFYFPLSL